MINRRTCVAAALLATAAVARGKPQALAARLADWNDDEHRDLRAVVVARDGSIVAERYFGDARPDTLHDVRSAGKSITSLLVGAAIDRGAIASVQDPVERYWPGARGSALGPVRIDEILTMRSGLAAFDEDPASPGNEDRLDDAPDPLAFMLAVPAERAPGTRYRYNSLTAHLAGRVVEQATRRDLESFAAEVLFEPLGIRRWQWGRDQSGHAKGQGNLSLTARDLVRIGEMVRSNGDFGSHRVLSAAWIAQSLRARVAISDVDPYADSYGYFWYAKRLDIAGTGIDVHFASGNGGNKIYVVPELGLVIAVTSAAYGHGYGQRRSQEVLRALLASAA
ncbi:serine hydrolase domain-containing protein [Paucibacter sp. R3-3]|uniref:Serine hydrolase domain-containing protein n=1 Tax=Roseateles agri TaxID=3098619 RepID=A0ABU5DHJ0_9BURK|nr:serine hydrolase domain-containing protein [Paucibacter sp. R3-3]MDY0745261.1 serine hydrolase domain-containing protein [Paucibacter sp. R3-3]